MPRVIWINDSRSKRDKSFGWWLWQGASSVKGYGTLTIGGKKLRAQRVAYEEFFGPIPAGLETHHLCLNKRCVNPAHLLLVSHRAHLELRPDFIRNRTRTHCPKGHLLDQTSTRVAPNGARSCRFCERIRSLTYWYQKRGGMSPEELAQARTHANRLDRLRRQRDPERVRAKEHTIRLKGKARDLEGFKAKERAHYRRWKQRHHPGGIKTYLRFPKGYYGVQVGFRFPQEQAA